MIKLLIIEDNRALAKNLGTWLNKHFETIFAFNGRQAIQHVSKTKFDLILLDLGLPDMTGAEVCTSLRLRGITAPILVLTATDEVSTKVALLDIGADDYLTKPFYIGELKARLNALSRRAQSSNDPTIMRVADLTLDSTRREVVRDDTHISLRRKEFDILEYLMHNQGTVVTRTMIINNSWEPNAERWNNTVDVHIKYLRDKIDRPFKQKLIKTAYGIGYMIDDKP